MSSRNNDIDQLVRTAFDQLTPEMVHVCLLPSTTYVKITRVVNVVRSETLVRADEGPGCPPGSKDLHTQPDAGAACEPRPPARKRKRAGPRKPRTGAKRCKR